LSDREWEIVAAFAVLRAILRGVAPNRKSQIDIGTDWRQCCAVNTSDLIPA